MELKNGVIWGAILTLICQKKNYVIISVNSKKAFDKIECPYLVFKNIKNSSMSICPSHNKEYFKPRAKKTNKNHEPTSYLQWNTRDSLFTMKNKIKIFLLCYRYFWIMYDMKLKQEI